MEKLIEISNFFKVSIDKLVKDCEDGCSLQETKEEHCNGNDQYVDFLIRAKKGTYAGKGEEGLSSRPNSHDLQYREGNLLYIDTYLGGEQFAGEEALWQDNIPFWSMNYVGRVLSEGFSGDFLKEALRLVPKKHPYRGPLIYQNGDYTYHCVLRGEFSWFHGYEEIFWNNQKVYECFFHGGCIK